MNNGVPLRTSVAIDESIIKLLRTAGVPMDVPSSFQKTDMKARASSGGKDYADIEDDGNEFGTTIRSMLVDTGASGSLNYTDLDGMLNGAHKSKYSIAVANNSRMKGSYA